MGKSVLNLFWVARTLFSLLAFFLVSFKCPAGLHFNETIIKKKSLPDDQNMVAVFHFQNTGNHEEKILRMDSSCGCTIPKLDKTVYAPGEHGKVTAVFDFGDRVGDQIKEIRVITASAPKTPIVLTLETTIPSLLELVPRVITIEGSFSPETEVLPVEINTDKSQRLESITAISKDNLFSVSVLESINPNQRTLHLKRPATILKGRYTIEIIAKFSSGLKKSKKLWILVPYTIGLPERPDTLSPEESPIVSSGPAKAQTIAPSEGHNQIPLLSSVVTPIALDNGITNAISYLTHHCSSSGRFTYVQNRSPSRVTDSRESANQLAQTGRYNIVRHAGVLYSLALAYKRELDVGNQIQAEKLMGTIRRAAGYLRTYIGDVPGIPAGRALWSRPGEEVRSATPVAKLGATGLGLAALSIVETISPKTTPREELAAMAHFLVTSQRNDGSFVSKFDIEGRPESGFTSLYYPGEAILGLVKFYELDKNPDWLAAATKGMTYLAQIRKEQGSAPPDHWALLATEALIEFIDDSSVRALFIEHIKQISFTILQEPLLAPKIPADSKLVALCPIAARLEGMCAVLSILNKNQLPRFDLITEIKSVLEPNIALLLHAQISSGDLIGGTPKYLDTVPHSTPSNVNVIRIDYVQHVLAALIGYENLIQTRILESTKDNRTK
ncbi:Protein of unknown function (DUF1573) [Opitutaceae bacterium TAV1]|nr:Protein of unknown function (DUF1573) [Opitutaceae bacterium TAV1]